MPDNLYSPDDFAYGINKNMVSELPVLCSPNPTNGLLNLTFDKSLQNISVSIYNLNGQKIYHNPLIEGETTTRLDLRGFENGIYILKMQSGVRLFATKIVKM